MDVFEDNLCLILDLEGFFINKKFHVRELGYVTWNGGHGRHAFSIPIPYETLPDQDKRSASFVCRKIHGHGLSQIRCTQNSIQLFIT